MLSEYSTPRWSRDGSRVFVGMKAQEAEVAAADSNKANVDVWHYNDPVVQSVQVVQLAQPRRATLPAAVHVANGSFTSLGSDSMRTVTLDASGTPRKSYINEDDDHAYELPLWGVAGWSRDSNAVPLYDEFDVWSAPLDGRKASNLTRGVGRTQQIQFRVTTFGEGAAPGPRGGGNAASDTVGLDLTKPLMLAAYGSRTKKSGYWTLAPSQAPQPIVWEDRNIGSVIKAEYAWASGKVLIDYTNSKGQKLQGTLALPAEYEPGKRYPMLVSFYEIVSNTHHNFSQPDYSSSPQLSTYNSNGYLTFQPDMVYEVGRPGSSALDNMTAAVKKVIALGYADPKRIGLHGHSWIGYQSAYILTRSNLFAAVVSGAPSTNLLSFYNTLYKSSSTVQTTVRSITWKDCSSSTPSSLPVNKGFSCHTPAKPTTW